MNPSRTKQIFMRRTFASCLLVASILGLGRVISASAETHKLSPAETGSNEELENVANKLAAGDTLVLRGGMYSQTGRRAITARGTPEKQIVIRAAEGETPRLIRPESQMNRHNNTEFVDCAYLTIQGLQFRGGSSGVRFIRGSHITFEECEISHTGNNALTMNSGNCKAFTIRNNHIHHTGLSTAGPTEGEGMYIGCNRAECRTTDSLIEGNHIHHLRGTSGGGNDGIEIKVGSYGNVVRDNVIHHTTIGREYPGIFVYGGGPKLNIVEGNVIWQAGEGIQAVSDALVRNNVILNCTLRGITAAPHIQVDRMSHAAIVNNTIVNHPEGIRLRWQEAENDPLANNLIYCPDSTAINADDLPKARLKANFIAGNLRGITTNNAGFHRLHSEPSPLVSLDTHRFWPKPGTSLVGNADMAATPQLDFRGDRRNPPFDIGAYETDAPTLNRGWEYDQRAVTAEPRPTADPYELLG